MKKYWFNIRLKKLIHIKLSEKALKYLLLSTFFSKIRCELSIFLQQVFANRSFRTLYCRFKMLLIINILQPKQTKVTVGISKSDCFSSYNFTFLTPGILASESDAG